MTNNFVLNEKDVKFIQSLREAQQNGLIFAPPRASPQPLLAQEYPASDVYIARPVSEDGIPGLTRAESGTGTSLTDSPGSGDCYIYRLIGAAGGGDLSIDQIDTTTKTVYNLSQDAIPQDWFIAHKTKQGYWFAGGTGSGGSLRAILEEDLDRGSIFEWTSAAATLLVPNTAGNGWDYSGSGGAIIYDDGVGGGGSNPIKRHVLIHVSRMFGKLFYAGGGGCAIPFDDSGTGTG